MESGAGDGGGGEAHITGRRVATHLGELGAEMDAAFAIGSGAAYDDALVVEDGVDHLPWGAEVGVVGIADGAQARVAALEDGELLVVGADAQERGERAALGEPALAAEALVDLAPADELAVEPNAGAARAIDESSDGQELGEALAEEGEGGGPAHLVVHIADVVRDVVWLDGHRWCHHSTVRKTLAVPSAA